MPIDLSAVGKELEALPYNFTQKDVMLYALGVGAGADPEDLKYVYENNLVALPTFGVIPLVPAVSSFMSMEEIQFNPAMLLHGEQYLEQKKHPAPVDGELVSKPKIANIYDKGKGALVEIDVETVDNKGDVVYYNRIGFFIRGEGGFGGEKGPEPGYEAPDREPDEVVELETLPQQAAIYRLSGDSNPLHIDPEFAQMAGFDKPILHGLCTFGVAGRAILRRLCNDNTEMFRAIKVRFSRPVFPGETIVTEMWKESPEMILFRCKTKERGEYCLTNAAAWFNT